MGVSTDAILFWGICYDENEDGITRDIINTIDEALQDDQKTAVPQPDIPGYKGPEWDAWRLQRSAWEAGGCDVHNHCSDGSPMFYVSPNAARTLACRGYPQEITSLEVKPEWEPKLRAFCERFGLAWREPKWWLVSYWG